MLQKEKEKNPTGLSAHMNRTVCDNHVIDDFGLVQGGDV